MDGAKHVLFAGNSGKQPLARLGAERAHDPVSYFEDGAECAVKAISKDGESVVSSNGYGILYG